MYRKLYSMLPRGPPLKLAYRPLAMSGPHVRCAAPEAATDLRNRVCRNTLRYPIPLRVSSRIFAGWTCHRSRRFDHHPACTFDTSSCRNSSSSGGSSDSSSEQSEGGSEENDDEEEEEDEEDEEVEEEGNEDESSSNSSESSGSEVQ